MFRQACHRLIAAAPTRVPSTQCQNFPSSNMFDAVSSECDHVCKKPVKRNRKVTVIGAGSDVGRVVSLCLKQENVIKVLALYDDVPKSCVMGVATDLSHINTTVAVQAFQGRSFIKDAMAGADVVLICGGKPSGYKEDRDLFIDNMQYVRSQITAFSHFAPQAVLALLTPPVDCNFAYCRHILKNEGVFDKTRVLGLNSVNVMRASQLSAVHSGEMTHIPVVGGTGHTTCLPVLSVSTTAAAYRDKVLSLVREADRSVAIAKNNGEGSHLSTGLAAARSVSNIMTGLFESPTIVDSALVEQPDPHICYGMEICATPVTIREQGISITHPPPLDEEENLLLEVCKLELQKLLDHGQHHAVDNIHHAHDGRLCAVLSSPRKTEGTDKSSVLFT